MLKSCWISQAINTHTAGAILITNPLQQWLQEHAPLLRVAIIACLVNMWKHFNTLY
jgi:hypothetical protein